MQEHRQRSREALPPGPWMIISSWTVMSPRMSGSLDDRLVRDQLDPQDVRLYTILALQRAVRTYELYDFSTFFLILRRSGTVRECELEEREGLLGSS